MREFSNFRVLIIDGDVDFALSLSNRLEIQKFTVETAVDAAGAGAALERFEADAALIDLRLGGGVSPSGLDLIADLRRRRPAIICVMVTAFAELKTVLEAWRAGADDLLTRPIDPPELFAVLERCIAKRKRLRGSEQRFRDFSDATSDWFWEMDENLRFSYFSDRFSDVTGVSHDSLLGKTREETGVPGIDPEVWEAHLADLAAHRSFRDFQHWRTLADGRQVYLSINGKAIFDEAGAFLGYRGAGRDITVRKRAEDALRQAHYELEQRVEERTTELLAANTRLAQEIAERNRAEAELRESEAHYREIFDESPVGIWESDWSAVKRFIDHLADHGVTDWRGYFTENPERLGQAYNLIRLVDVSRAVLKLYGVADVTSLAKIYRADTVPQDNLDGFREALLSLIEGPMTSHYEARERRADGAEIVTRNTLAVPVNHFDDWSRVIYSVEDITERKHAGESLRKSEARYREIFDESPVGIWEDDWSDVKRMLDDLAAGGVTDLRRYFDDNPDKLKDAYNLGKVIDISRATWEMYGAPSKQALIDSNYAEFETIEVISGFLDSIIAFMAGETAFAFESLDRGFDGARIVTSIRLVIPPQHRHDWSRVIYAIEDITERKHAEDALRESEARYREIFDESPVGIWEDDWSDVKRMLDSFVVGGVTDLREYFHDNPGKLLEAYDLSKIVDISHATIEMFGAPNKQALMDWTQADLEPDEEIDGFLGSIIAFMAGETSFEFESPCYGYEGEPIVTSNRLVIPPQHRHDWSRVIYAIEDITKRKQAEKALRESDDRYALAVAGTNDGIWDWNIQTGENYFSPRWKAILGYGEDELTHHVDTFFDHVHPDDRALVDEANRAHFEKRKPNDLEFRMRHKDGHYVWVRERGQAVWDSDGKPLRMAGSLSDITERRAAEEAIRTRDAWLRGIMENAPMEIVLKDTDGKIMAISRNVAAEVGRPREDYIGRTTADFLPAKIAEIYMKADREVVESGRLVQQEVVEENPDGSPRHMLNAKFPLKDDKGKIIGICSLTTDVTEMKEVQAQLHQAQKMEAVGQLTGGIAHDFNNLLAIVMGNIELIQDEIDGDGALGGYLKAAFSAVDDAATLTQSLLAFSRNQPLMPKVADMNTLVRKMIGLVGRTLGDAIIIKTSFADDLAPVSIDSGQLQNALLNLVVNARDAMPNGGEIYIETGSLTVGGEGGESDPLAGPGDYVSLTVRDTGEGMPRDVLEHVFEPFFTTKEVGEGSGLGLSMVFGFVKQSGGHVTIHSEVGRGATVTLCLPTTTEAISDEKKPIRDLDARGGGETILFVEDDERVLHIIVDQLTGMGYEVHHACDGGAALDIVDRIPAIDLLLTDVKLPGGMNGAELALEMRRRLPSLPVLYASGHSAAELKKAGHLKDNADLIEKPFTRRELAAKVAAMLS